MRKIKFRGKRIDNGDWVYGSLIKTNTLCHILSHKPIRPPEFTRGHSKFAGYDVFAVDPETLGEFTGKLDDKEVEICEADIVKSLSSGTIGVVVFRDAKFQVQYKEPDFKSYNADGTLSNEYFVEYIDLCDFYCEIIGKLADNPELLEE